MDFFGNEKESAAFDRGRARIQTALIALGISFIFLAAYFVQVITVPLLRRTVPAWFDSEWFLWAVRLVPMYLISMPLSLLLFRFAPASAPEKKKMRALEWFGVLAICFGLTYAGNFLGNIINTVLEWFTGHASTGDLEEVTSASPFLSNLLFCGILAPVMEELFFRKVVIDRLRRFGDLPAVLLSGVAFGLIHGNLSQFFYAAAIGMVLGYVYLRTGNLFYTIGLHMSVNLVGGVYTSEMLKRFDPDAFLRNPSLSPDVLPGLLMFAAYLFLIFTAVVTTPVAIALLYRKIKFEKAVPAASARDWVTVLCLNPGVWVFVGTVVFLFI